MGFLGVDIGTTGCKAVLFDEAFRCVKKFYQSYELFISGEERKELDAEGVKEAAFSCIQQCCEEGRGNSVWAVSFSAQGEAVVPVGESGKPLDRSIVTFDTRNKKEVRELHQLLDTEQLMKESGLPLHTMFTLTKLLWIKKEQPEIYRNTWKFMCFADYLAFALGAPPVMDYSLASRTMLFDVQAKTWNDKVFRACGLEENKMPALASSGTKIGEVSAEAALKLGLKSGTAIVTGGHDQVCCALGAGVLKEGTAMNSMGTTDTVLSVSPGFHSGIQQQKFNIPCGCYYSGEIYANHSFVLSTGSIIEWFRKTLFGKELPDYLEMEAYLRQTQPPTELLFLPHFSGSGTPELNAKSKGSWTGIGLETDIRKLYKAILEGIAFECKVNLENMENAGIHVERIRCIGGSARSDGYLQMKADIFGRRVERTEVEEAGCFGAALLAAYGIGDIADFEEVLWDKSRAEKVFEPQKERVEQYQKLFKRYQRLRSLMNQFYE